MPTAGLAGGRERPSAHTRTGKKRVEEWEQHVTFATCVPVEMTSGATSLGIASCHAARSRATIEDMYFASQAFLRREGRHAEPSVEGCGFNLPLLHPDMSLCYMTSVGFSSACGRLRLCWPTRRTSSPHGASAAAGAAAAGHQRPQASLHLPYRPAPRQMGSPAACHRIHECAAILACREPNPRHHHAHRPGGKAWRPSGWRAQQAL